MNVYSVPSLRLYVLVNNLDATVDVNCKMLGKRVPVNSSFEVLALHRVFFSNTTLAL